MRQIPYDIDTAEPRQNWRDNVVELGDVIKIPTRDNTAGGTNEPATETGEDNTAAEGQQEPKRPEHVGSFDDGNQQEEVIDQNFNTFIKDFEDANDPVELSRILIQFFNLGRIFFVPGLYFKLAYPGQEAYDLKNVTDKAVENEKQNKPPMEGFNDYEKRLYTKLPALRKAQAESSYTKPEMDQAATYLARRIREMTVAVFLARHMWAIYIMYLEVAHGSFLIEMKGGEFINNKIGVK